MPANNANGHAAMQKRVVLARGTRSQVAKAAADAGYRAVWTISGIVPLSEWDPTPTRETLYVLERFEGLAQIVSQYGVALSIWRCA